MPLFCPKLDRRAVFCYTILNANFGVKLFTINQGGQEMSAISLLLAMVWVLSGLFVAFLMRTVDESKGADCKSTYWIKSEDNRGLRGFAITLLLICLAPLSLFLGIVVMADYCSKK